MKVLIIFVLISIIITFANCNETSISSFILKEILTTVYPSQLNDINIFLKGNNVKAKRDKTEDYIACLNEQNDFSDCFGDDIPKTCNITNGERCVKFYKDPALYLPSCEKLDKSLAEGLSASYKFVGSIFQLFCINNLDCTIAKQLLNKINSDDKVSNMKPTDLFSPSEEDLNSDCNRKDCVEKAIDMYEKQKEAMEINMEVNKKMNYTYSEKEMQIYNERMSSADKVLEYLHSCAQKSDAVTIITSNILLLSIITVFIIFLIK